MSHFERKGGLKPVPKRILAGARQEIDLVVSGGGLRGYFMCGAMGILRRTEGLVIRRVARQEQTPRPALCGAHS